MWEQVKGAVCERLRYHRAGPPTPRMPPEGKSDLVSTARRRRLTAASMAVTAALTLSACGTGFSAQTNQVYQPSVGANERGDVDSFNTLLVGNADGTATLSTALVNNLDDDQTLTSVSVTDGDGNELAVRSPRIALPLPSRVLTQTGGDDAAVFTVAEGAEPGDYVEVTFTFSDSGPLRVDTPVVARTAEYDSVVGGTTAGAEASDEE